MVKYLNNLKIITYISLRLTLHLAEHVGGDENDLELDFLVQLLADAVGLLHGWHRVDEILL